jgi:hypothetical protein
MMMQDPDDDNDDDDDSTANTDGPADFAHDLDEGNDVNMTDETSYHVAPSPITAILTAVDSQLRLRIPEATARARYPHLAYANIDALLRDPFFTTVLRDPDYSVVHFPTGIISSCLTSDLDRTRSSYLSPVSPAIDQPRRRATPRYVPESPPREPDSNLQDDITYDLSAPGLRSAFESSSVHPPRPTKPRSPLPTQNLPVPAPSPPPDWGHGPIHNAAVAPAPWHAFTWGISSDGPNPEPQPWSSRRPPSHSSSDSDPDHEEDSTHLQHYMQQTASSFTGGTTVNAMAHVRDTRN